VNLSHQPGCPHFAENYAWKCNCRAAAPPAPAPEPAAVVGLLRRAKLWLQDIRSNGAVHALVREIEELTDG
jgi:hypothetical protein